MRKRMKIYTLALVLLGILVKMPNMVNSLGIRMCYLIIMSAIVVFLAIAAIVIKK